MQCFVETTLVLPHGTVYKGADVVRNPTVAVPAILEPFPAADSQLVSNRGEESRSSNGSIDEILFAITAAISYRVS